MDFVSNFVKKTRIINYFFLCFTIAVTIFWILVTIFAYLVISNNISINFSNPIFFYTLFFIAPIEFLAIYFGANAGFFTGPVIVILLWVSSILPVFVIYLFSQNFLIMKFENSINIKKIKLNMNIQYSWNFIKKRYSITDFERRINIHCSANSIFWKLIAVELSLYTSSPRVRKIHSPSHFSVM